MHQVRYFLAVADELNFTRAAEKCGVAQPSLTRGIQRLESELGGELFRRERSLTHLTQLGKLMLPSLKAVYESAVSAKALADSFRVGDRVPIGLALGHTISISMVSLLLTELARVLPGSEVQLVRGEPEDIAEQLKSGELEIALAGSLGEDWDRLRTWPLFVEKFVLVVPKQHDLARHTSLRLDELADSVLLPRPCERETSEINAQLQEFGLQQNANYRICSDGDLLALVDAGHGCAFFPASSVPADAPGRLEIDDCTIARTVNLFAVVGRQRSPGADIILKILRAVDWSRQLAPLALSQPDRSSQMAST